MGMRKGADRASDLSMRVMPECGVAQSLSFAD